MQRGLAILTVLILPLFAGGQHEGNVKVYQDPYVDTLLQYYESVWEMKSQDPDNKGIEGYRVQIFFDSGSHSGDRAMKEKEVFEEDHPEVPAYVTWRAPNYRVRVGDFRTRLEAENFLQKIKKDYPNAWVIKDEINFPKLN